MATRPSRTATLILLSAAAGFRAGPRVPPFGHAAAAARSSVACSIAVPVPPADNDRTVVDGPNGPILVTKVKGSYYAVDATCPHLGLPMKRGKVADGADGVTLTCSFHNSCWAMKNGSCKKWVTGALGVENEAAAGVMGKLGGQKRDIKSYKVAVNQDGSLTLESNPLTLPAQPRASSVIRTMVPESPSGSEFETLGEADHGPVGVLLLSVGAPETPDDVEEYLYNVFCDPEIRTLPPAISWAFKRPLAWLIARERAEEARESMRLAGGRSPQLATIQAQARALQAQLADRGVDARPFIAMRYWKPFTEDAVEAMKAEGIQKLVILPLYPQFSLSTSGSALRVLERLLYTDPGFPMKTSVVPAWYNRPGFLQATAKGIADTLASLPRDARGTAHVLYTAQGLPRKYVDDLGDPYQEQVERCVQLVSDQLGAMGIANNRSLAYQGAFGPQQLRWLEPSTASEIERLAAQGVRSLVLVPISFVFEHMATLNVMDCEFAGLAAACGIQSFVRVPTLGVEETFIGALATVVMEALPDLSRPSFQQINAGTPVALNMVNEYTRLYTKDQLQLVPQEQPWGFTQEAEIINGRIAMTAITLALALSLDPSLKAIVAVYRAAAGAAGAM